MAKNYRNGKIVKYVVLSFSGEDQAWPEVFGLDGGETLTEAQAKSLSRSLQDVYPETVFIVSPVLNSPIRRRS